MRSFALALVVVLLVAGGCSSGGGDGASAGADDPNAATDTPVAAVDEATALLCTRWSEFAELMERDVEPTDELIDEVLERQRDIEEVLPNELASTWAGITEWNQAFIEFFGAAGYQEISDDVIVVVFGDQERADEASRSVEEGFGAMHDWSRRTCTTGDGDAAAFCTAWDDIAALLTRLDEESPTEDLVDELFTAYAEAGADVPAEIRDDWNALLAFAAPFRDVLVSVEYDLDRVNDEILTQAFGSVDAVETLERAADAGEAAINAWTLEGCGGFCGRWGETSEAIDQLGQYLGWVRDWGEEGPRQFDLMHARIDLAGRLVPDELAADWGELEVLLNDWIAWWEATDFDERDWDSPEVRERARHLIDETPYFDDLALEQWGGPEQDREQFLRDMGAEDQPIDWWTGTVSSGIMSARDDMAAWVEANCDLEGGRPGRLRVTWPALEGEVGNMIVVTVMPRGSTIGQLGDLDAQLAGYCEGIGRDPWGYEIGPEGNRHHWGSDWFRGERSEWEENSLCGWGWELEPATLAAGPYTLLVAVVPGAVRENTLPGPPSACLALDITIDGDTEIPLPSLPGCDADLSALVYQPDPWRMPEPVDPAAPGAGTLLVTLPSLVLPEGIEGEHGGELMMILLPADTTLNEVGREEVWPSGGIVTHLEPSGNQPHVEELERLGSADVPIMAVPPTGAFGHLESWWLHEATPAQLPLTLLASGQYDLHVQLSGHSEEGEDTRCGQTTVTIDSDTRVDLPELGECP